MMQINNSDLSTELTYTRFDRMVEKYPRNTAVVYLGERFFYHRLYVT
jgi:hypothetical protein